MAAGVLDPGKEITYMEGSDHRTRHPVVFIAATAALCGLLFGYDTGVISGALLFLKKDFMLSPFLQGVVTSSALAGAALGAGFSGRLADRFGRRLMVIVVAGLFLIASLISAWASGIGMLITGRFLVGLAIGVCSYTGPLYIAEISPPESRGALVSLNQLLITVGILVSYLVDYAFANGEHWRWMLGLAAIPAIVLGLGMLWLPETPRWLVKTGKTEAAMAVLLRIRRPEEVERELDLILSQPHEREGHWTEALAREYHPVLIIGIGLAVFQQITGINTIIYYAPTIFQLAGLGSAAQSILATAGVGAVNVIMTVVSLRLLDRLGRRPLLLTGIAGMTVSLVTLGWVFRVPESPATSWLAVASVMTYVAAFAISLGPIFWLLIAEIYPLRIRGVAMSIATMSNWAFNLLVALTFLILLNAMGPAQTFWMYALLSVGAFLFSYRFVPETKGRALEEIHAAVRTT